MLHALHREIDLRKNFLDEEEINTIYFGGGSPSILESKELGNILELIDQVFKVNQDAEVTLEANPDDLLLDKAKGLKSLGINRLSIGIQSFRNEDLKLMNRAHDASMAKKCIEDVRSAGFDNLNLDLIYGIPGLDLKSWEDNLDQFFSFDAEHLSAYNLTIEDRTAFGHWAKNGKLKIESDEHILQQFKILMERMSDRDYEHYEISNFCRPGFISKHNSSYWKGEKYLGIGPSAHSFDGNARSWNMRNNPLYIKAIDNGEKWFEEEILSAKDKFNEYVLTSLRTSWGVDLNFIGESFGETMMNNLLAEAKEHLSEGRLYQEENILLLSEKGKFVADKITSDLFAV